MLGLGSYSPQELFCIYVELLLMCYADPGCGAAEAQGAAQGARRGASRRRGGANGGSAMAPPRACHACRYEERVRASPQHNDYYQRAVRHIEFELTRLR